MVLHISVNVQFWAVYVLFIIEFAPSSKPECKFGSELMGYWVLFTSSEREEVSIEAGELRFSTLGRFTCKSKHWEEDYYKVFSVFTNGW